MPPGADHVDAVEFNHGVFAVDVDVRLDARELRALGEDHLPEARAGAHANASRVEQDAAIAPVWITTRVSWPPGTISARGNAAPGLRRLAVDPHDVRAGRNAHASPLRRSVPPARR